MKDKNIIDYLSILNKHILEVYTELNELKEKMWTISSSIENNKKKVKSDYLEIIGKQIGKDLSCHLWNELRKELCECNTKAIDLSEHSKFCRYREFTVGVLELAGIKI